MALGSESTRSLPLNSRNGAVRAFIAYAAEDDALAIELNAHLAAIKRERLLDTWHRTMAAPGDELESTAHSRLQEAEIVIVLLSAMFLASDLHARELVKALDLHNAGRALIIPIMIRPFDISISIFSGIQILPRNGIAVTLWNDRNSAWMEIAAMIRGIAMELRNGQQVTHMLQSRIDQVVRLRDKLPQNPDLSANERIYHTSSEWKFYSILGVLLCAMVILVIFLITSEKKNPSAPTIINNIYVRSNQIGAMNENELKYWRNRPSDTPEEFTAKIAKFGSENISYRQGQSHDLDTQTILYHVLAVLSFDNEPIAYIRYNSKKSSKSIEQRSESALFVDLIQIMNDKNSKNFDSPCLLYFNKSKPFHLSSSELQINTYVASMRQLNFTIDNPLTFFRFNEFPSLKDKHCEALNDSCADSVFDLGSSVAEWVQDSFVDRDNTPSAVPESLKRENCRVFRGGAWSSAHSVSIKSKECRIENSCTPERFRCILNSSDCAPVPPAKQ